MESRSKPEQKTAKFNILPEGFFKIVLIGDLKIFKWLNI